MIRLICFVLPLIVYFCAEQIYGGAIALCVGFGATVLVNIVRLLTGGRFDVKEVLTDFGFLLVFGVADIIVAHVNHDAASLVTALIFTLILTAIPIIGVKRVMGGMFDSVRPGFSDNAYLMSLMKQSLQRMALWSALASLLYFIALLQPNTNASLWINDYSIYVVIVAYLASEIILSRIRKNRYKNVEWVPLIKQDGKVVGGAPRPLVHNGSHWLHPVVHLHVLSHDHKRLLLQLRPQSKKIQPGRWDTAVGGHITLGENLPDALRRETAEEIGITNFNAKLTNRYVWHSDAEDEYVFVFQTQSDGPFNPTNIGEVDELRFWSAHDISNAIGKGLLTPNLEHELQHGLLNQLTNN